jgi:hypothetical protein
MYSAAGLILLYSRNSYSSVLQTRVLRIELAFTLSPLLQCNEACSVQAVYMQQQVAARYC